jgi:hypothetical protein
MPVNGLVPRPQNVPPLAFHLVKATTRAGHKFNRFFKGKLFFSIQLKHGINLGWISHPCSMTTMKKVLTCDNTRVNFSWMKTSKVASRGVEPSVKKQPVPSPKYANNNISGHPCEFDIRN